MKTIFLTVVLLSIAFSQGAVAAGTPKIAFEKEVYNFEKTGDASVVGTFKFRNTGAGILKVDKPTTSCGCTAVILTKDLLHPGDTAEVAFTLSLRGLKGGTLSKSVKVLSNDPAMPASVLVIKGDYAPLYEVSPLTLQADVPKGETRSDLSVNLIRIDGKPLQIGRLETSQPWIVAKVDPAANAEEGTARIRVEVRGGETARRFSEFISVYAGGKTDAPAARISVLGQVKGELTVSPERIFWSITDPTKAITAMPESLTTRRVVIRSTNGKDFELKNPLSTIKGLKLELNALGEGKGYELVARLGEIPPRTLNGTIMVVTSMVSTPEVEIPVSIRVVPQNATAGPAPAAGVGPVKSARAIDPAGIDARQPAAATPAPVAPAK